MMGYGARVGVADGELDPLYARSLYLEEGGRALLIVECDLCLLSVSQASAIRREIVEGSALGADQVLLGCTHTHSGPDTGLAALLAGRTEPDHFSGMRNAIVDSGRAAIANAAPAWLGVGQTKLAVGRNRRRAGARLDPDAWVLRIDHRTQSPSVILFGHGCHATALGHENLRYSADWPGAAIREIEGRLPGARAMFALGAHGDVDPRTRGLLDLAQADQSAGIPAREMVALGTEVGRAIATCAEGIRPGAETKIAVATARVGVSAHGSGAGSVAALEERRRAALVALDLEPTERPRTADLYRLEHERTGGLPREERRARIAKVRLYLRDRSARIFAGSEAPQVEVQVLRIGALSLAAFPLECCTDVGLAWRGGAPTEYASVVSIANGWLRYLPHRANFAEPGSETAYEVLQSTFVPEASERLLECALELANGLDSE